MVYKHICRITFAFLRIDTKFTVFVPVDINDGIVFVLTCILSISLAHIDFGLSFFSVRMVAQHGERLSIVRLWWVAGIYSLFMILMMSKDQI